jgi:hypothetical protein
VKRALILLATHAVALAIGVAAGIYVLPILIAPPPPSVAEVHAATAAAEFKAQFRKDLAGSDALHWGAGEVTVGREAVALMGRLAPGPDYKLYLSPEFVETEDAFLRVKGRSVRIGDVKTFDNFVVPVPASVDISQYDTVVVWCETFSQFITAAKYR